MEDVESIYMEIVPVTGHTMIQSHCIYGELWFRIAENRRYNYTIINKKNSIPVMLQRYENGLLQRKAQYKLALLVTWYSTCFRKMPFFSGTRWTVTVSRRQRSPYRIPRCPGWHCLWRCFCSCLRSLRSPNAGMGNSETTIKYVSKGHSIRIEFK